MTSIAPNDCKETPQSFEEFYEAMNSEILRWKDEVIYAFYRLCRSHQQIGLVDGDKLGVLLLQELSN